MVLQKLDSIVCSSLTAQGLPVHFYLPFLSYGIDCFRALEMDIMRNAPTVKLPVNSYGAVDLPCRVEDVIAVGVPVGGYVKNMPRRDTLNPLKNVDSTGAIVPYPDVCQIPYRSMFGWPYYSNGYLSITNERGEVTGGIYGYGGGSFKFSYQVFKDRNQIQLDDINVDHVMLKYMTSDPSSCGCDTMVDPRAALTVKNYIIWQYFLNNKKLMRAAPEFERHYISEALRLRGRMNPLSKEDVVMSLREYTQASIKS